MRMQRPREREVGGLVLAEPRYAPWVRFAVLADPMQMSGAQEPQRGVPISHS